MYDAVSFKPQNVLTLNFVDTVQYKEITNPAAFQDKTQFNNQKW